MAQEVIELGEGSDPIVIEVPVAATIVHAPVSLPAEVVAQVGVGPQGPPATLSDDDPQAAGTPASGVSKDASRSDHVHPMPSAADVGAAADGDPRLSDSRAPTAHKTSHAAGGTDALSPADIGAATAEQGSTADTAVQPGDLPDFGDIVTADAADFLGAALKGAPSGLAELDSGGKVPVSQLPSTVMEFQGTWDASTNTPTLADGSGDSGDVYRVVVAGTRDLGSGSQAFGVGDWVLYAGGVWQRSDSSDFTAAELATLIDSVVAKTTPVDADLLPTLDSEASNALKKLTFANLKTWIKSWVAKGDVGLGNVDNTSDATKNAATVTLTNKRITRRTTTVTSSATPTINTDNCDAVTITALAEAITSMTTNLSGTPSNFDSLLFRIKDDGSPRAITWGASFASRGATLPTTTTANKVTTVGFFWNAVTSTWDCVAVATEG